MKTRSSGEANQAMTLIEVLVVLAVAGILVILLTPRNHTRSRSQIVLCMNNLKQDVTAFLLCEDDNQGRFPLQTSITNSGTMEYLERNQTFPHYQKLAGYVHSPWIFVCPADTSRHAAENYEYLTDTNLSYFLNADVSTNNASESIMTGDRHLRADGQAVHHGTFIVRTNMNLSWTPQMHSGRGILGFVDGHAQLSRGTNLNAFFEHQGLAAMRLSVP